VELHGGLLDRRPVQAVVRSEPRVVRALRPGGMLCSVTAATTAIHSTRR
jgi:hypothetical protein